MKFQSFHSFNHFVWQCVAVYREILLLLAKHWRNRFLQAKAAFHNVSCFVFEQSIVFLNAAVQNTYNVFYFKTLSMCIFIIVKKQSGIGFIVDALFGYFAYQNSLYTVVELHTNFVLLHFERQPDMPLLEIRSSWKKR